MFIDPLKDPSLANLIESNEKDKSKLYVDTRLDDIFRANNKLALVWRVEKMPAEAMILFYTYGDYENAKYQGVLIFMSLTLDSTLSEAERANYENSVASLTQLVEGYLKNLWKARVNEDQLLPLFTRIANNLCFIRAN